MGLDCPSRGPDLGPRWDGAAGLRALCINTCPQTSMKWSDVGKKVGEKVLQNNVTGWGSPAGNVSLLRVALNVTGFQGALIFYPPRFWIMIPHPNHWSYFHTSGSVSFLFFLLRRTSRTISNRNDYSTGALWCFPSPSHPHRQMEDGAGLGKRASAWERINLISSQTLVGCRSALFSLLVAERIALQDSSARISNALEIVEASVTACRLRKRRRRTRSRYTGGCLRSARRFVERYVCRQTGR